MASRIAFKPSQRAPESPSLDAERSPKAQLIGQVLETLRFQGWFFASASCEHPGRSSSLAIAWPRCMRCWMESALSISPVRKTTPGSVLEISFSWPAIMYTSSQTVRAEQPFRLRLWLTIGLHPRPTKNTGGLKTWRDRRGYSAVRNASAWFAAQGNKWAQVRCIRHKR